LISKKFEKKIVFESSVLAWIRFRNRIRIEQKCWIRIRIKWIRIHNPDFNKPESLLKLSMNFSCSAKNLKKIRLLRHWVLTEGLSWFIDFRKMIHIIDKRIAGVPVTNQCCGVRISPGSRSEHLFIPESLRILNKKWEKRFIPNPNPGGKKPPDPRSGTLAVTLFFFLLTNVFFFFSFSSKLSECEIIRYRYLIIFDCCIPVASGPTSDRWSPRIPPTLDSGAQSPGAVDTFLPKLAQNLWTRTRTKKRKLF
jgi:hypothetical protein